VVIAESMLRLYRLAQEFRSASALSLLDVTRSRAGSRRSAVSVKTDFGGLDVLVYNAGIYHGGSVDTRRRAIQDDAGDRSRRGFSRLQGTRSM